MEVEGVEVRVRVLSAGEQKHKEPGTNSRAGRKGGLSQGVKASRPRSTQPLVHDPGGNLREQPLDGEGEVETPGHLPTTSDLAKSFLQTEPPQQRAELRAALAKSQYLQGSQLSEDIEEESAAGIGTGISLPGFVADFLKGVGDRLQLRVKNVQLDLDIRVEIPTEGSGTGGGSGKWEAVTFRLSIDDVDIEGVTSNINSTYHQEDKTLPSLSNPLPKTGEYRRISLRNLRGMLVSDASLFANLSQYSGPPSPVATTSSAFQKASSTPLHNQTPSRSTSSTSSVGAEMTQSALLDSPIDNFEASSKLEESTATSDGGRFADAGGEDESGNVTNDLENSGYGSSVAGSQYQDMFPVVDVTPTEVESIVGGNNIADSDTLPINSHYKRSQHYRTNDVSRHQAPSSFGPVINPVRYDNSATLSTGVSCGTQNLFSSLHSSSDGYSEAEKRNAAEDSASSLHGMTEPKNVQHSIDDDYPSAFSATDPSHAHQISNTPSPNTEDLTQSKIFSHEEAESMYMSAISHNSITSSHNKSIPGGWNRSSSGSDGSTSQPTRPFSDKLVQGTTQTIHDEPIAILQGDTKNGALEDYTLSQADIVQSIHVPPPCSPSSSINEEASSVKEPDLKDDDRDQINKSQHSDTSPAKLDNPLRIIKQFLSIDAVSVSLPQVTGNSSTATADLSESSDLDGRHSTYPRVPGEFSEFTSSRTTDRAAPRRFADGPGGRKLPEDYQTPKNQEYPSGLGLQVSVQVGRVSILGDMGLTRLFIMALQQIQTLPPTENISGVQDQALETSQHAVLRVNSLSWKFLDILRGFNETEFPDAGDQAPKYTIPESETLLIVRMDSIDVKHIKSHMKSHSELSVGTFEFGYPTGNIISFDSSLKMRESTRDVLAPLHGDLALTIIRKPKSLDVRLTTLPLHVTLDLARLDETFSWFGGLSSVLGLGSSMMSTVTVVDTRTKSTPTAKRPRGVRFETPKDKASAEVPIDRGRQKFTVRIGGLLFELQGKDSSLRLESTAMKLVSREEGLGMQVDKLKFSGLYFRLQPDDPAVIAYLSNIRVEYLSIPKEVDLARLLALLSPSRDKYEPDDDILLDTLLRQRRQGGVVRLTIDKIEGDVCKLHELRQFAAIAEELTKLSTVTKYLPEDDRPGILTLFLLRDLALRIHVNDDFGSAKVSSQNFEVAHVTLPSLISLGIKTTHVHRQGSEELVGDALSLDEEIDQQTPMIMARFIGDEMEPTVKIKLWNVRTEYHVSTVMAILGLSDDTTGETIIADLTSSIATLTGLQPRSMHMPKLRSEASSSSERSSGSSKVLRFDVAIRDSIIGLNPRGSSSRGLIVLTNSTIVGAFPRKGDGDVNGVLEIKKASLMVVDDIKNVTHINDLPGRDSSDVHVSQVQDLCDIGYVSVSYISAAKATLQMVPSGTNGQGTIDLEVRDDLIVLETCADSTQTLQSILNGLKPPMQPTRERKYRTEVIPVEDMLASFSGDAYATVGSDDGDGYALGLDEGDMVEDEVPQNLEFVSGFYNPDPASTSEDIANSMLEDDLDHLAAPPVTREIGEKRLLQSFQEQFEVAPGSEPLDFREDHFGVSSAIGGTAHRWNSDRNTYDLTTEVKIRTTPLRVRVRDVHVIWNLFDGYDWQHTRDTISQAVADVESKAVERLAQKDKRKSLEADEEEDSVIGDFLFNSIYIGIPANRDPRDLARQVNRNLNDLASETESYATSTTASRSPSRQSQVPGARRKRLRLHRSKHHKMTFELRGVSMDLVVFPTGSGETQSSIDIRVQDLEIFDHVPTSTWKKFATYMHDAGERESGTSMIHIEILNVKPVPELAASEIILKVRFRVSFVVGS